MAEFELDSLAEVVEEDKLDELFETGDGVNGVNGGEDGTSGKAKGTSSHNEEDAEEGTSEEAEGTVNHRAEDADALGGVEASIFGGHLPEEVEAKASNEAPAIPCEAQQQPLFDLQAAESALPPLVPLSTSPGNSKLLDGPFAREAVPWLIKNGKGPPFASREHRLTICDLPNELLRNAFDCMQSRVHMRNCQKVCKAFYDNSLHHMYRNVRIDLPEELTEWQRDLLGDNHRGLRHIQQLHLWPVVLRIESTAVFRWVAQLLKRLEHGQLQDFWWVSPRQMPFRLYDLLWSRQPNLTRVDIRPLYGPEDDTSEQDKFANLQVHSIPKLDHLFIVPDVVDLLGIGSKVLEKLEITKLTVYGRSWKERDIHTSILPSAREDEDKLVQGLFAHQRQSAIRCGPKSYIKPSCLSMLELSEVNLRFCRSKWFACNDFRNLSELVIKYCPYADVFLTRLMQSEADSVPALDYFTLVHKLRDVGTERTLIELNELVKRCFKKPSKDDNYLPGPRMLDLHLRNIGMDALPEARAIGTSIRLHRKTLESLCVDYMYRTRGPGGSEGLPKAVIWEPHELNGMLRGCRQLRELALAVPSYSWHYRPGQLLVAQGVVFTSFVHAIVKNVDLTILNVLNWPASYNLGEPTIYHATVQPQLCKLTTDLFNYIAAAAARIRPSPCCRRKLEVIAFGVREQGSGLPFPRYFVPGQASYLHFTQSIAYPVSLRRLRIERMEGDLLRYEWINFDKKSRREERYEYYLHDEIELEYDDEYHADSNRTGVEDDDLSDGDEFVSSDEDGEDDQSGS